MTDMDSISRLKCRRMINDLRIHMQLLKSEGVEGVQVCSIEQADVPGLPEKSETPGDRLVTVESSAIKNSRRNLEQIRERLGDCKRCPLHQGRRNIVFGQGNPSPDLVFVGEGPGHDEDVQGVPFVGRAGKLLDRIFTAMNIQREEVYITNIVKCRPPGNRNPEHDEIATCTPFLLEQLDVLQPKVICALGNVAASFLTGKQAPMTVLRGKFHDFKGICVRPTYHPAALLRYPKYRRPVWEDVQEIMQYLGRPIRR